MVLFLNPLDVLYMAGVGKLTIAGEVFDRAREETLRGRLFVSV